MEDAPSAVRRLPLLLTEARPQGRGGRQAAAAGNQRMSLLVRPTTSSEACTGPLAPAVLEPEAAENACTAPCSSGL
jgi:hypothetical protein